jgi:hypothetical protein
MTIAGELVTVELEYDGGRQVTVYVPLRRGRPVDLAMGSGPRHFNRTRVRGRLSRTPGQPPLTSCSRTRRHKMRCAGRRRHAGRVKTAWIGKTQHCVTLAERMQPDHIIPRSQFDPCTAHRNEQLTGVGRWQGSRPSCSTGSRLRRVICRCSFACGLSRWTTWTAAGPSKCQGGLSLHQRTARQPRKCRPANPCRGGGLPESTLSPDQVGSRHPPLATALFNQWAEMPR